MTTAVAVVTLLATGLVEIRTLLVLYYFACYNARIFERVGSKDLASFFTLQDQRLRLHLDRVCPAQQLCRSTRRSQERTRAET